MSLKQLEEVYGIELPSKKFKKVSEDDLKLTRLLVSKGVSIKKCSEELGYNYLTLYYNLFPEKRPNGMKGYKKEKNTARVSKYRLYENSIKYALKDRLVKDLTEKLENYKEFCKKTNNRNYDIYFKEMFSEPNKEDICTLLIPFSYRKNGEQTYVKICNEFILKLSYTNFWYKFRRKINASIRRLNRQERNI